MRTTNGTTIISSFNRVGRSANLPKLSPLARLIRQACYVSAGMLFGQQAMAAPQGGEIVGGEGSIAQSGSTTTVQQQSQNLAIEWQQFNVAAEETVRFVQPSSSSAVLNRILDQNPSEIYGSIEANGRVFLINPNGLIFGQTANINVGSLVASTLDISTADFMEGKYTFKAQEGGEGGMVINRGIMKAATGGSISLIGGTVANEGLILADYGQVNLGAGRQVTLDFDGDGLIRFQVDEEVITNAAGVDSAVSNSGQISADGGSVLLTAQAARDVFSSVVNNEGVIRAGRIENEGGVVRLVGTGGITANSGTIDASGQTAADTGGTVEVLGDKVALMAGSDIDASGPAGGGTVLVGGDYQGSGDTPTAARTYVDAEATIRADATEAGDGGKVIVWGDEATAFHGSISTRGGSESGDGGFVEVSGKQTLQFDGNVDTSAVNGAYGMLLLDPTNIYVVSSGGTTTDTIIFFNDTGSDGDGNSTINASAIDSAATDVRLQATSDIRFQTAVDMQSGINLTVQAGSDVILDTDASITTNNGNVTLQANYDFDTSDGVTPTGGQVVLGADISTGSGSITLEGADTGTGILVTGAAADTRTLTGGNVAINSALATETAGTSLAVLADNDITISAGGISATSGDVTLTADNDDTSAGNIYVSGNIRADATGNNAAGGAIDLTGTAIEINGDVEITATSEGGNGGSVTVAGTVYGGTADSTLLIDTQSLKNNGSDVLGGAIALQDVTSETGFNLKDLTLTAYGKNNTDSTKDGTVTFNGDIHVSDTFSLDGKGIANGDLTFTAGEFDFLGGAGSINDSSSISAVNALTLKTHDPATEILLGAASTDPATAAMDLTADDLAALNGFTGITIGDATQTAGISTAGAFSVSDSLTLATGGTISLAHNITNTGGSLTFDGLANLSGVVTLDVSNTTDAGVSFNSTLGDDQDYLSITDPVLDTYTADSLTVNAGSNGTVTLGGTTDLEDFSVTGNKLVMGSDPADTFTFLKGLDTSGLTTTEIQGTVYTGTGHTPAGLTLGDTTLVGGASLDTTNQGVSSGAALSVGTVTGGGNALTLNAGTTGAIDVAGGDNISTLTVTNSDTTTFTGALTSTGVAIDGTQTSVTFQGDNTSLSRLTTAAGAYSVIFTGTSNTIAGQTTFNNTDGLTLGDNDGDTYTFTGGLISAASTNTIRGLVYTEGAAVNLGEVTLAGNATLDTTNNGSTSTGAAINVGTITGAGHTLTLDAGTGAATGGEITLAGGDNVKLVIENSRTTRVTGNLGQGTAKDVVINGTVESVSFEGSTDINALTTVSDAYDLAFTGASTTVTNNVTFNNTGTVTLGNEATDSLTFSGTVEHSAGDTTIAGNVYTAGKTVTLDTVTLNATTTVDSTNGGANSGGANLSFGTITGQGNPLTLNSGTSGDITLAGGSNLGTLDVTGDVMNVNGDLSVADGSTASFSGTRLNLGDGTGTDVFTFGGGLTSTATDTHLQGTVRTTGDAISLGDITLDGTVTLDTTNNGAVAAGANVTAQTITGNSNSLTVDAGTGGTVSLTGSDNNLGSLSVTASAATSITDSITVNGATSITAGTLTLGDATHTDIYTFKGGLTGTVTSTHLWGEVRTEGLALSLGALTLDGDSVLDTTNNGASTAGANLTVGLLAGNGKALTLDAGTGGNISVDGASSFTTLTVDNSATTTFTGAVGSGTEEVVIDDTQNSVTFLGNVNLSTLNATSGSTYDVSMTGSSNIVSGSASFNNGSSVTFGDEATDSFTFTGGLDTTGATATILASSIDTQGGAMALENVVLSDNTTLDTTLDDAGTQDGQLTLIGNVSGAGNALTLKAGTQAMSLGNIGSDGSELSGLTIDATGTNGQVKLTGDIYANAINMSGLEGGVVIDGARTLDADAGAGNISFSGTAISRTNSGDTLTLLATSGDTVTLASIGSTGALDGLTVGGGAGASLEGDIYADAMDFTGATGGIAVVGTWVLDASDGADDINFGANAVSGGSLTISTTSAFNTSNVYLKNANLTGLTLNVDDTVALGQDDAGVGGGSIQVGTLNLTGLTGTLQLQGQLAVTGGGVDLTATSAVELNGNGDTVAVTTNGLFNSNVATVSDTNGATSLIVNSTTASLGTMSVGALDVNTSGATTLYGNLTTTSSGIDLGGTSELRLGANVLISSSGAVNLNSAGGINTSAAVGTQTLTVDAGSAAVDLGKVGQKSDTYGNYFEPNAVTVTTSGTTTLHGDIRTGSGGLDLSGAGSIALADTDGTVNVVTAGADVWLNKAISGTSNALNVHAGIGAVNLGTDGSTVSVGSLAIQGSGALNLAGNITTQGNMDLGATTSAAVDLGAATTLTTTGGGTIDLTRGVSGGSNSLTVNGGTVNLNKAITANGVTFGGGANVVLQNDLTVSGGSLSFQNASINGAGRTLTLNAGGGDISLGTGGALTLSLSNVNNLRLAGTLNLSGGADFTAANQVLVAANSAINTTADNGIVSLEGTPLNGPGGLTISSGTGTVTLANVGQTTRLAYLTINSASTTLGGNVFTSGQVNLSGTSVEAGSVGQGLSIDAGGAAILGSMGQTKAFGNVNITAGTINQQGSLKSTGYVTFTSADTITMASTAQTVSTGGAIEYTATTGNVYLGLLQAGSGQDVEVYAKSSGADILRSKTGGNEVNIRTTDGGNVSLWSLDKIGDIGSPLIVQTERPGVITLNYGAANAYITNVLSADVANLGGGVISDSGGKGLSSASKETSANATKPGYVDWSVYSSDISLFGVIEPGLRLPDDQLEEVVFEQEALPGIPVLAQTATGWQLLWDFDRSPSSENDLWRTAEAF